MLKYTSKEIEFMKYKEKIYYSKRDKVLTTVNVSTILLFVTLFPAIVTTTTRFLHL
jgi:hypothetical protein